MSRRPLGPSVHFSDCSTASAIGGSASGADMLEVARLSAQVEALRDEVAKMRSSNGAGIPAEISGEGWRDGNDGRRSAASSIR